MVTLLGRKQELFDSNRVILYYTEKSAGDDR